MEADVRLATGPFTISEAGQYLATSVPMDVPTAEDEAAFFASNPGQGMTYQIGKIQITKLLADVRRRAGDEFDLRGFHDYLWQNGNVPISLLRLELLGASDEWDAVLSSRSSL